MDCTSLTSITIPNSVTFIGRQAFKGCTGLKSVIIPGSVTTIEREAFQGCTGLTSVTFEDGVTAIESFAFRNCTGLTSVTIPASVTTIGTGVFSGCAGMTSIVVAADNAHYSSKEGVLFNKNKTVLIRYPQGRIGPYVIPESVTTIGSYAFSDCAGLTSITIPNSVTEIGAGAFHSTGLTSITIPTSVTTIGRHFFLGRTGPASIIVLNPIPPEFESAGTLNKNVCLYVPQNSINAYRAVEGWRYFNCVEDLASAPKGE
jgi:hypothetical protein